MSFEGRNQISAGKAEGRNAQDFLMWWKWHEVLIHKSFTRKTPIRISTIVGKGSWLRAWCNDPIQSKSLLQLVSWLFQMRQVKMNEMNTRRVTTQETDCSSIYLFLNLFCSFQNVSSSTAFDKLTDSRICLLDWIGLDWIFFRALVLPPLYGLSNGPTFPLLGLLLRGRGGSSKGKSPPRLPFA